jgi:UbiD family decarboxylase
MSYGDIREFLTDVESDGDLKRINGADCDLEMSGICEILYREGKRPVPAVLYDDIPGYPRGYRTLFGLLSSPRRLARALYLSEKELGPLDMVRNWRNKISKLQLIPPEFVDSGPVSENTLRGDEIDLNKFPIPRFHEFDGGRYIGTGHTVIMKDPDEGWINLGAYRCMLIDHNRMALHILEGQHGGIICSDRYFARGQVMPVAVAIGVDPTLWFASGHSVPWGTSEYDYAGGVRGEPIKVIKGPYTGLPLPAFAEIVIEGECRPGDLMDEGPFGEWCGYYANLGLSPVPEPVIHVKTVLHRNDPILTCANPAMPPSELTEQSCFRRTAEIWGRLERAGVPGIKAVWCHEEGGGPLFNVISIQQRYAGHAREAGLIASQFAGHNGRYTVVVDDDINPSNLSQVIWAIATRADPEHSIRILDRQRTTSADTTISPEEKRKVKIAPKPLLSSRAVIDACQPYEWKAEWYPVARITPDLRVRIIKKWEALFKELC